MSIEQRSSSTAVVAYSIVDLELAVAGSGTCIATSQCHGKGLCWHGNRLPGAIAVMKTPAEPTWVCTAAGSADASGEISVRF